MDRRRWAITGAAAGVLLFAAAMSGRLPRAGTPLPAAPPPTAGAAEGTATQAEGAAQAGDEAAPAPVFRDWLAFGSGCRARSAEPGDVTMERVTLTSGPRVVHRARFHLDEFRLTSAGRGPGKRRDIARECAIRVQLGPPPGKRIAQVTARTQVVSDRSSGVKLTILGELKIGPATLGREVLVHAAGTAEGGREDLLDLAAGTRPDEKLPDLACAEGKLVGFDYTWIAERRDTSDEVSVELSGARVLDIDAELTDC